MILRYRINVEIEGPLLTQSSGAGRLGYDTVCARKADGSLYIPGTLLKGRLRHALADLKKQEIVCKTELEELFGKEGNSRSRIFFSDLDFDGDNASNLDHGFEQIRIAIDEETGTVKRGALQVIETPIRPGQMAQFKGELRLLLSDESDDENIIGELNKLLEWIDSIGAERGIGFGRLNCAKICKPEIDADTSHGLKPGQTTITMKDPVPDRLAVTLTFADPLMVSNTLATDNLFESGECIPGSAIRGALANMMLAHHGKPVGGWVSQELGDNCALAECFEKITFSQFVPVLKDVKTVLPQALPLSWAVANGKWHDAARDDDYEKLQSGDVFPQYKPDWKWPDTRKARAHCGWEDVDRRLVVRTAIDAERDAAADGQLFAYKMLETDKHVWTGVIDVEEACPDARRALLRYLENGLISVGKTGAFASVAYEEASPKQAEPERPESVALVLQSPAVLRPATAAGHTVKGLKQAYAGSLLGKDQQEHLKRVFVRERWAGGPFLKNDKDVCYQPVIVTEPGSVFVFDNHCPSITQWLHNGLAAMEPCHVAKRFFAAKDGFGEVRYLPAKPCDDEAAS